MVFSGLPFLYLFMPGVLLVYFIAPKRYRNFVLLVFSLAFYFFGEQFYTVLLLISSVSDFIFSLLIEKYRGTVKAKVFLIAAIVVSLAMLGFFKYIDFFIVTANSIFGSDIAVLNVRLPIGISFFTFQTMSYTIDVYRGRVRVQANIVTFATFVCLFPQLVAGPIVRYSDIAEELENRQERLADIAAGIRRFCLGLMKKVIIANSMAELVEYFRYSDERTVLFYWLYALAFTFQIYFDFSGYSDMAIGLGRMFGFKFPENFNYPYISRSITEFWRRWHMTLGNWFRDYVYIPLGGRRVKQSRWIFNIAAVWMLTGFWHGADWNFIVWGLMMAVLLVAEKFFITKWLERAWRWVAHVYTMGVVVISFVIFSGAGMRGAWTDLAGMFGAGGIPLVGTLSLYYLRSFAPMFVIAAFLSTPLVKRVGDGLLARNSKWTLLEPVLIAASLILVTANLVDGSFNPFIYFRF
ncbi:MAG: MBOAT family protein [Defluviitaleaceae bacterium]|nr:MBOAT family protein [Defluviitaleaceae bacterium]